MQAPSRHSFSVLAACALALAACDGGGDSSDPVIPPSAPTGLTATPFNGAVALSWDAAPGAATYTVYQSPTAGLQPAAMTQVGSGIAGTAFNAAAPNDVAQYYRVTAVNAGGESPGSAEISATALSAALPATPLGLTAAAGDRTVTLSWDDVPLASAYRVYWRTSPGVTTGDPFFTCATSPCAHPLLLNNGTTYHYAVTALVSAQESALSAEVSATPAALPYIEAFAVLLPPTLGIGTYQVKVCTSSACTTPVSNATVTLGGRSLVYDGIDTYEGEPNAPIAGATLALVVTIPAGGATAAGTYRAAATMYTKGPTLTSPTSGAVWAASQSHAFTWTHAAPTTSSIYALAAFNMSNLMASVLGTAPASQTSYTFAANVLSPGSHFGLATIQSTSPVAIPGARAGSGFTVGASSDYVSFTVQ